MAKELGQASSEWREDAAGLKAAINRNFWMTDKESYGYFLDPNGKLDPSQEGCGLAFAVLFDVASPRQALRIIRSAHLEPYGVVDVYPAFARFSDERPGRHNAIVWPMVQGMWVRAAAKAHDSESLRQQTEDLAKLETGSNRHFFEIYNAKTGKPDGGWQNGHAWGSAPDQTWSASAYISMMTNGLFGMRFEPDSLHFVPTAPKVWGDASLSGLHYRMATLDINLRHSGRRGVMLDGRAVRFVPGTLSGEHTIEIDIE
jgi:glycogen debranching enzyme